MLEKAVGNLFYTTLGGQVFTKEGVGGRLMGEYSSFIL